MNETKTCYYCSNNVEVENGVQWGSYFYCDRCFKSIRCDVDDYHYPSVSTSFKKVRGENSKEFLGGELECTLDANGGFYQSDHRDNVFHIRKHYTDLGLNFEKDSSIGNGMEMITQPMTMNYLYKHENEFKDILAYLQDKGYYSHDKGKCGLHIHISRDFLGDTEEEIQSTIEKIMLFVETYQDKVETFSRRKHQQFSVYNAYTKSSYKESHLSNDNIMVDDNYFKSGKMLYELNKKMGIGHSSVVNTSTSTGATIEFRMFRGTLKFETFMASFEFVHNLVNVCKENQASKISWAKVINYSGKYIKNYVESLNIIDDKLYLRDYTKNIEDIIEKCKAPRVAVINNYKKDLDDIITNLQAIYEEKIDFNSDSTTIKHTLKYRQALYNAIEGALVEESESEDTTLYDRLKVMTKDYTSDCVKGLNKIKCVLEASSSYQLTDDTQNACTRAIELINEKISKTNTSEC